MAFLFFAAAALTVVFWACKNLEKSDALTAQIIKDGKIIKTIRLDREPAQTIIINGNGKNKIETGTNKIRIADADCPDKDCVKCGWLTKRGDSAVCLPNLLVIKIVGESDIDGVTY